MVLSYPTDLGLYTFFTFTNEVANGWLGGGLLFSWFLFIMFLTYRWGFEVSFASASWAAVGLGIIFMAFPIVTPIVFGMFMGMAFLSTALLLGR